MKISNSISVSKRIDSDDTTGPSPSEPSTHYKLTLTLDTDTFERLNSDGNYYNIDFPYSFVNWSGGSSSTAAAGSDPGNPTTDPFSAYRATGNATHTWSNYIYDDPAIGKVKRARPISANLDVTIVIPSTVVVGSNTDFLAAIQPSFRVISGELPNSPQANQAFTEYASANLLVTIENSGNTIGRGGFGGKGQIMSDGKNNQSGGGGGGGAGRVGGTGGVGGGTGATGTAFAGGAGGIGSQGGTPVRAATAGSPGGDCFAIFNRKYYDVSVPAKGPTLSIVNKPGGFILSGGGGGGGGAGDTNPTAGGVGGARASSGSAGVASGSDGTPGAGGVAGLVKTLQSGFLNPTSGGSITVTNQGAAGSVKGRDGTY